MRSVSNAIQRLDVLCISCNDLAHLVKTLSDAWSNNNMCISVQMACVLFCGFDFPQIRGLAPASRIHVLLWYDNVQNVEGLLHLPQSVCQEEEKCKRNMLHTPVWIVLVVLWADQIVLYILTSTLCTVQVPKDWMPFSWCTGISWSDCDNHDWSNNLGWLQSPWELEDRIRRPVWKEMWANTLCTHKTMWNALPHSQALSPCVYSRMYNNSRVWLLNLQAHWKPGKEPGIFYHVSDIKGRENLLCVAEGVTAELTPHEHSHLRA